MPTPIPPPEPSSPPPTPASGNHGPRRWLRVLAPVGVVAVALGGFAVAQAATDDSGNDSPRDLVERAAPTTSTSLPDIADDHGGLRSGSDDTPDAADDHGGSNGPNSGSGSRGRSGDD